MRTAMSASRRSESSGVFEATTSTARRGWQVRRAERIGGRRSAAKTSLAPIRTVPATIPPSSAAARRSAALAAVIAAAAGAMARAASVGGRPRGERRNSRQPSAASS